MTKHYNPSIVERANRILATKSGDFLSDEVQGPVACIAITPVANILRAAAGSGTIYTTPADKDFYLTGFSLSFVKAASDTGTLVQITCIVDGVTTSIFGFAGLTLTAERDGVAVDLSTPIKVDRNTAISCGLTGTYTAIRSTIRGYTEEVTR